MKIIHAKNTFWVDMSRGLFENTLQFIFRPACIFCMHPIIAFVIFSLFTLKILENISCAGSFVYYGETPVTVEQHLPGKQLWLPIPH